MNTKASKNTEAQKVRKELKSDLKIFEIVVRTEIRGAIGKQNEYIEEKFSQVNEKFHHVDEQFNQVNEQFNQVNEQFNQVNERFNQVNERFNQQDISIKQQLQNQTETLTRVIENVIDYVRENHPSREEFEELKNKLHS